MQKKKWVVDKLELFDQVLLSDSSLQMESLFWGVTPKINIHRSGTLLNPLIQSIARAHTHNFPKYSKMDLKNWPLFEVTQQYNGNLLISLLTCFCHIYTQRKRDACHHHLGRRSRLALNINCIIIYFISQ